MEEHLHEVTAEWKQRAYIDQGKYEDWYRRSIADPNAFWAKHGKRIDWIKPFTKVKNTSFDRQRLDQMVRGRHTNVSYNCIDRHLKKRGNQTAIIWEGDDPYEDKKITYQRAARAGLPLRQCAEEARRQEGRPRHHLYADDPGSGLCDARLRAHRRGPFGRLRRLLAGFARRPHRGLRVHVRHHRRRRPARRQAGAAQGQHRQGARQEPADVVEQCSSCAAPAARSTWTPGRDLWYHEETASV